MATNVFKLDSVKREDPIIFEFGYPNPDNEEDLDYTVILEFVVFADWSEKDFTEFQIISSRAAKLNFVSKASKKIKQEESDNANNYSTTIFQLLGKYIKNEDGRTAWNNFTLKEKQFLADNFLKEQENRARELAKKVK